MSDSPAQRACDRVRVEMARLKLSQADLAGQIGWTQSKVSKVLHGGVKVKVNALAALCDGVNLRLTEVVRDQGYEFCAEMTPTEFRVLEELRRRRVDPECLLRLMRPVSA